MPKRTFVLDDATVRLLQTLAARRVKPQSVIVREAVAAYAREEDKLTDEERNHRLSVLDRLQVQPPTRPIKEVDAELRQLRRNRRVGWQRQSD